MPLVIENNRILYAGDDGIEINLQNLTAPPSAVNVTVRNNMIIGSAEDGIQFVDFANDPQDTNRRFEIMGNLIANNKKAGIGLTPNANTVEDYSGADTVEAIRAHNNTFYGNDYGISGGDNVVAFNSIVVNSATRGVWKVQSTAGANSVVAHSLFYNNKVDADQSALGVGIITGQDPLFQAAPNPGPDGTWGTVDDDFSGLLLQPGSPAIDKGVTQYVANNAEPIPSTPITAFAGAAPDLGWREYGSPVFIIPGPSATPSFTPPATFTPVSPTISPVPTFTPLPSATPIPTIIVVTATSVPPSPLPSATIPVPTATTPVTVTSTSQVTIAGIIPNTTQSGAVVNLTITGSGFANGAVVVFEGGHGTAPQVMNTSVVTPSTIVVTVNMNIDTSFGDQVWDVRVTNPDNSTAVLPDALSVMVPK